MGTERPRSAEVARARRPGAFAQARGFSLIELMIVVTIVGILAAIALPAYRAYVLKSNRTDAMRVLTTSAQILQRCYSQTFAFNSGSCPTLPTMSPNNDYSVVNTVGTSTYSLTATAYGPQASDTTCNSFTVDQTGKQSALNSSALDESSTCWGGN